jgi:hypothetical protein
MSVVDALLAELSEDGLAALAERLRPYLATSPAEDGWLRGADQIAEHIGCPRSRVYALAGAKRLPLERDGSALIARKSELDAWIRNGGGKRP